MPDFINCKNLTVTYGESDNNKHLNSFIVEEEIANDFIFEAIDIMAYYEFPVWGVTLSPVYKSVKRGCIKLEDFEEILTNQIKNYTGREYVRKLTID